MLHIAAAVLRGEKRDDLKKSPKDSLRSILFARQCIVLNLLANFDVNSD